MLYSTSPPASCMCRILLLNSLKGIIYSLNSHNASGSPLKCAVDLQIIWLIQSDPGLKGQAGGGWSQNAFSFSSSSPIPLFHSSLFILCIIFACVDPCDSRTQETLRKALNVTLVNGTEVMCLPLSAPPPSIHCFHSASE